MLDSIRRGERIGGNKLVEDKRNLKGNQDTLKYYRLNDTGTYEQRNRLINISNDQQSKVYYYPSKDKILFEEHEVQKFSLDQYGESIPFIDGELTIFNNYFFDFWGYYLNAEGTSLYGHLKRYAYGSKDWCYPNFDLISEKMDKHRKTLYNFLDLLERYGFAYQFGVLNASKNNVEESPIFKIRKQIPLLTSKLILGNPDLVIPEDAPPHIVKAMKKEQKGLPPRLRAEHEKFVGKHMQNKADQLEKQVDFEKIYSAWMQYGEVLKSKTSSQNQAKLKTKGQIEMNEIEHIILNFILTEAGKVISKPSFDTWFRNVTLKVDHTTFTFFTPNEFAKDWLQEKYKDLITKWIKALGHEVEKIHFIHI